jgi:hypothetical protein
MPDESRELDAGKNKPERKRKEGVATIVLADIHHA